MHMASFSLGLPTQSPSHFCLHYSSIHRPGQVRSLPHGAKLFLKSELLWQPGITTPRTKSPGELRKEKMIREKLLINPEPPQPSSYDMAWVAMVPAPGCPEAPRFPQCVEWIMHNQHDDGSWGLGLDNHPSLAKDALSSTLACVLALKTWGVGDDHVRKALHFIGHNISYVTDDECEMPVGFNVIFPGMVARCIDMGLEIPLTQADVDGIFRQHNKELESMASGSKALMAYVAEGLGNMVDWNEVMAYQRKNGSFFNSPATTAAAVKDRARRLEGG